MGTLRYECQADHCRKAGTNKDDFKRVDYNGAIRFSFVLCNEHADKMQKGNES